MDDRTLQFLIDKIDEMKADLKEDIADLKSTTHERLSTVEKDNEDGKKFRWKFSGALVVGTLIFNLILAWVQRGSGK